MQNVALFWDAENISAKVLANELISFLQPLGNLLTKKAYAKCWQHRPKVKRYLEALGFSLIASQLDIKNSADLRCMFDCVDSIDSKCPPDIFVFVTGDADYIPIIRLLRQCGKQIIVIARRGSASEKLRKFAHKFYFLDEIPLIRGSNE